MSVRACDKAQAIAHFDRLSSRYSEYVQRSVWQYLRRRERAAVLSAAEFEPGLSLIDVGCGDGFYARAGRRAGMHVWAVDASPRMVTRVVAHVDEARVADVESLQLSERFDVVVCAGVLDFVVDPDRALRNVLALVADGGRAALLVPRVGLGGLAYRIETFGRGLRVNLFDLAWIERTARSCGMRIAWAAKPFVHNVVLRLERDPGRCSSGATAGTTPALLAVDTCTRR